MHLSFLIVYGSLALMFPVIVLSRAPDIEYSYRRTAVVAAKVVDVSAIDGCLEPCNRVVYSLTTADGVSYRGSEPVCEEDPYFRVAAGGSLPVEYIVSKPGINRVQYEIRAREPLLLVGAGLSALLLALACWMSARIILPALGDRQTFRTGRIARATVVFAHAPDELSPGIMLRGQWVTVVVARADGSSFETRVRCRNAWLVWQLKPGAIVTVAYEESRPENVIILESYAR